MVEPIRHAGTVVIGGGQAGLAAGRELARRGLDYLILEESPRLGDSWRRRWDSLHLFTPAEHDGLPGLDFPAPRGTFPSKDDVAQYLESYAGAHGLAVRLGTLVTGLVRAGDGWHVEAAPGSLAAQEVLARKALTENIVAENVIVATGTNAAPRVPRFAAEPDAGILQLHSSEYRNPAQVPAGDVLVVGAGTSGSEIDAAGVTRLPRVEGVADGRPFVAGGRSLGVAGVIWRRATGRTSAGSTGSRSAPAAGRSRSAAWSRGCPACTSSASRSSTR